MDTVVMELNQGWRFHYGECEEAWYKGFDDRDFREVMLPHDWSVELPFSKKYSSGTGYLAGGIGWYRGYFQLPEKYRGKCVRVVFDGVYKNSQVWCNSYHLGKRPNGYISFSYDITSQVVFGDAKNEISVKVSHPDLADSRWFTGSGITRKVSIVIEELVHPAEYGCFFKTQNVTAQKAEILVEHEIVNTLERTVSLQVESVLCDLETGAETVFAGNCTLGALQEEKLVLSGMVTAPKLWDIEYPFLYSLKTYYRVDGGERYLVDEQQVGIRDIQFDPDKGFFLNGKETKIKGVCVHHDGGCLGAAMRAEVWERRLELLKQCGCNAIRCSHNPHMPELYELCDKLGFLMMDEAFDEWENPKNKWSTGHNVYPPKHQGYAEDFPQWHDADLRAMVRRDRNHPSIIMWSVGNEIDYPNDPYCHPMFTEMTGNNDASKPAAERQYNADKPNAERLTVIAKKLVRIVKEEDTSRPVTLAAAFPELSSHLGFLDPLDVVGYNYKEHLYEEDHKRFPEKPFLGSENGHGYRAWRAVADNPYISGQFLWTGIDYLGEAHGWPIHGSGAGIVTCAGLPKPEFYRRKTFWCEEPVIHLATRRQDGHKESWRPMSHSWNYEPGTEVLVKCYSNVLQQNEGAQIVLKSNGKEVGRLAEYTQDGAYCFETVYEPGVLTAEAQAADGTVLAVCSLTTTGAAEQYSCILWKPEGQAEPLVTENGLIRIAPKQPGYLTQLILQLEDAQGKPVVWENCEVRAQVIGDAVLAGLENGNLADVTPYSSNTRKTFAGTLVVYVKQTGNKDSSVMLTVKNAQGVELKCQMV